MPPGPPWLASALSIYGRDGVLLARNNGLQARSGLFWQIPACAGLFKIESGERGIRTPDTDRNPYNGLANRRLQPLGHLSKVGQV